MRLGAEARGLTRPGYLPSNPSTQGLITMRESIESLCAQAACVFSCSGSKRSPFFQIVKLMAAILRARVSLAISGLIPLADGNRFEAEARWRPFLIAELDGKSVSHVINLPARFFVGNPVMPTF